MNQKSKQGAAGEPTSDSQDSQNSDAKSIGSAAENASGSVEPAKKEPTIHLDQFLKTCGVATGGQAKVMIQAGEVLVNDEIETRRRKQLKVGDEVTLGEVVYIVALNK